MEEKQTDDAVLPGAPPGGPVSPVSRRRRRDACPEVLRWDGTAAALAVLQEWGAKPKVVHAGVLAGAVRVWGSAHGYTGAQPGDWLVRTPDGNGADRYTPEMFELAFEPENPGAPPQGIRVTAFDPETGGENTVVIWDDYVLIRAGSCYVDHIQAHANGTHVITVKGRKP